MSYYATLLQLMHDQLRPNDEGDSLLAVIKSIERLRLVDTLVLSLVFHAPQLRIWFLPSPSSRLQVRWHYIDCVVCSNFREVFSNHPRHSPIKQSLLSLKSSQTPRRVQFSLLSELQHRGNWKSLKQRADDNGEQLHVEDLEGKAGKCNSEKYPARCWRHSNPCQFPVFLTYFSLALPYILPYLQKTFYRC